MVLRSAIRLIGLVLLCSVPAGVSAQRGPLIPREHLFGYPRFSRVMISPDGTMLGFLAPHNGALNVFVRRLSDATAVPVTQVIQRPIQSWWWAENSEQIIYTLDTEGDENFHILAATIEFGADLQPSGEIALTPIGGSSVDLTPFDGVQARLVGQERTRPDEILVAANKRDPAAHDLWRINTRTGRSELVFQNDAGYYEFLADRTLSPRVGLRMVETGGVEADIRQPGDGGWFALADWNMIDATNSRPLGFSRDGRTVFIADSRHSDRARLYAFTRDETGNSSYAPLADHRFGDLQDVFFDPSTGWPIAVLFERALPQWTLLDDRYVDDFRTLHDNTDGRFRITSRDRTDTLWVVEAESDVRAPRYFLYNRRTGNVQLLYDSRPDLRTFALASMESRTIRSRDGLDLVCYLTTPTDRPAKNLPMVLLVHGGPWSRDHWGFSARHQWLANRGYAVLSVNYRGSTGFGKSFTAAGNGEWAAAMHDDLIDACLWAIEEGIADPARIAIMGGSYGGYASLVGLTFTPRFFAAAVDIVGPSNLNTLLATIPTYWKPIRALFEARIGPTDNRSFLHSISPIGRVDQIERPLLIGQGAHDPRVKPAESDQIVTAMQKRGIPVTYVIFPDEGHGFRRPENNLAFAAITEAFLAQHLGGRLQRVGDVVENSSAKILNGRDLIRALRK